MTPLPGYRPYEPQLQLRPWTDDIWTVEGPEISYRLWGLTLPCPTRMTIIRLPDGELWVHSQVACMPDLVAAVEALGPVAAIIAPNASITPTSPTGRAPFRRRQSLVCRVLL